MLLFYVIRLNLCAHVVLYAPVVGTTHLHFFFSKYNKNEML